MFLLLYIKGSLVVKGYMILIIWSKEIIHSNSIESVQMKKESEMSEKNINYEELADIVIDKLKERTEKKTLELNFINKQPGYMESKIGGIPFLPVGAEYPVDKNTGKKLHLLVQINFAEMPHLDDFPQEGILQIFIADGDLYGMDIKVGQYQEGWRIIFHEDITNPLPIDEVQKMIPEIKEDILLPFEKIGSSCGISFSESKKIMSVDDCGFDELFDEIIRNELSEEDLLGEYWEYPDEFSNKIYDACEGTGSRIGGYPYFTQFDCRDKDSEEILLLQLDSFFIDDKWFLLWGDSGVANFFITQEDLRNRNFDNVNYNWDCM